MTENSIIRFGCEATAYSRKLETLFASDLMRKPRPHDWLVRGFLEHDTLVLLFGDPAVGKSLLALDWAASVATGRDWCGNRVERGLAFYLAGEGHHGLSRRLKAWGIATGMECLWGEELWGMPLVVSRHSVGLPSETRMAIEAIDKAADRGGKPRLIIIDTLARCIDGNENSASDMGGFITACDEMRLRYGCAVLILHHSGHENKNRARAHSSLTCAVDAAYHMHGLNSGIRRLDCTKSKDFEPPAARHFIIHKTLLPSEWWDGNAPTTVPVLVECDESGKAINEPPPF